MHFKSIAVLLISLYSIAESQVHEVDKSSFYKWKQYENGVMPPDAFIAGIENGENIYIGLDSNYGCGKIVHKKPLLEYVDRDEKPVIATENLVMFTTLEPENFRWIPIQDRQIRVMGRLVRLVRNGLERYLGRSGKDGHQTVGAFECESYRRNCTALKAVNRYGNVQSYQEFEVLIYQNKI